jgi:2-methylcitrate dehydratase PrpD
MRRLAGYLAQAADRPLPAAVAEKARHHLLDTLAAMVSGACLLPGLRAIDYVAALGGTREALVPGSRLVTSAVNAALAGGMCAHADETDDSHQPAFFHPGCGIIPAALAMAERGQASGAALLRAVVLGYDVGARMNLALGGIRFHLRGYSAHSFGALFGAAAAAGALARLDPDQCRWLLSYSAQQASGVSAWMRDIDHVEKAFDLGGMTARNGVCAATMVQAGMTGVDDVFSGERSFFVAFGPNADPAELVAGLGTRYEILRTNIKKWSVGSPIQAALDSLEALIGAHRLDAGSVTGLLVQVQDHEAAIVNDRDTPDICLQHLLALMLVDGTVSFASSHDRNRMRDPRVLAVRRRITLTGSAALRRAGGRQAILQVTTRDGRTLRHHTQAVRGTPGNPMPQAEVEAKCFALFEPVLGPRRARKLIDCVGRIDTLADVRELRPLLRA